MGTYLHLFQTQGEFEKQYNTSAYTEPWVSVTEEGDCEYFVGNITMQGQDVGQFTFYYIYYDEEYGYIFMIGNKESITAVDTSVSPNTITASGITFTYSGSVYDYIYSWISNDFLCITKKEIPSVGDSAIISMMPEPIVMQERNPQAGEVIEVGPEASIEVVSVSSGELLNRVDYNKIPEPPLTVHFIRDETSEFDFDVPEDIIFETTDDFINYIFPRITLESSRTSYTFGQYNTTTYEFINNITNDVEEGFQFVGFRAPSSLLTLSNQQASFGENFINSISNFISVHKINVLVNCSMFEA